MRTPIFSQRKFVATKWRIYKGILLTLRESAICFCHAEFTKEI